MHGIVHLHSSFALFRRPPLFRGGIRRCPFHPSLRLFVAFGYAWVRTVLARSHSPNPPPSRWDGASHCPMAWILWTRMGSDRTPPHTRQHLPSSTHLVLTRQIRRMRTPPLSPFVAVREEASSAPPVASSIGGRFSLTFARMGTFPAEDEVRRRVWCSCDVVVK